MTLFTLTGLLITILCAVLASLILKYAQNSIQRLWGLFNIIVTLWAYGTYLAGMSASSKEAIFAWKLAYLAAIFIAIIFYHLVYLFSQSHKKGWLIFCYIQGFLFAVTIIFSNLFIDKTIYIHNSIYYHKATILFSVFLVTWSTISCLAFYNLHKYKKTLDGINRIQASYLFWGMLIGFTGGVTSTFPSYGATFYPALHLSVAVYALIMPFAIFKYRLMELTVVIKRSIIYSLLITSITILYLLSVFVLEKWAQQLFGYESLIISVGTAFGLGLIFIPLRHRINSFVDRYFFKGTREEIATQNELLRREVTQSEKHKAVAALASGIAHEVRNPLTALKTFYEHFPEKKNDPEFIAKFTHIAGKEIGRIEGLIQQLLDFAKPSPPSFRETDINKLIQDTLDLLANKLEANNIQINQHLSPNNHHLKIDPNQFKQALLNILLNAIDAMPGGGQLTVASLACPEHSRRASRISSLETFVITIADTGKGIAKEDLPHIFEPFFSKKASGTGLGLAITQGIIQEHGGNIKVKSTVGEGTTFTIELPIKK